jgi:predicted nucleotidyltransferase
MNILSPTETEILDRLSMAVENRYPSADSIVVFGSRARGTSHEQSDLDVAILLNVKRVDQKDWDRIWEIKWSVLEQLDAEEFPLSLMLIPREQYARATTGVELAIKQEGIPIWRRMKHRLSS